VAITKREGGGASLRKFENRRYRGTVKMNKEQLRKMVMEIDEEIQKETNQLVGREMEIWRRLAMKLGRTISNVDPICKDMMEIFHEMYNIKDVAIPPLAVGGFLYKGCLYKLYIGQVFGRVQIDLSTIIKDIPPLRLQQLFESPNDLNLYLHQVCDLFDFGQGLDDLGKSTDKHASTDLLQTGKSHLESAVKTALDGVDREAAMHNSFLAAELMMKGFLVQKGYTEKQLKKLSHDLEAIAAEVCSISARGTADQFQRAIRHLPKSVNERYEVSHYSNESTGKAIMSVQFLAGSVLRHLTGRNMQASLKVNGQPLAIDRMFP
jgi:HEPN domain-containing protein